MAVHVGPGRLDSWTPNRGSDATQPHWLVSNFHDHLEDTPAIAFTNAAGNFEGDDRVRAQSMDGANTNGGLPDFRHRNNANMATYPDGTSPHMQMYLTTTPGHPASTGLDASVVYHEYTHGLVARTIVDASGVGALGAAQSGAINEGTADFYAVDYLVGAGLAPDDPVQRDVVLGRFSIGDNLRTEPMDCRVAAAPSAPDPDCDGTATPHFGGYTYADFGKIFGIPEVHDDGEIWAQTMWQLRQVLIAKLGVTAGTDHVRRLLTNGMRLAARQPELPRPAQRDAAGRGRLASRRRRRRLERVRASAGWATSHRRPVPATCSRSRTRACRRLPARRRAALSGTVTDAIAAAPAPGVRVAFTGHDSGIGPELSATTNASGAYAINDVPTGTYPLLRVRSSGYVGSAANVTVAASPAVTTRSFSLERNVASAAAGAQIASFTGPDYTAFGCGPSALVDEDSGLVWGSRRAGGAASGRHRAGDPAEPLRIDIDPTAGCGDALSASLSHYEVHVSTNGANYVSVAAGAFGSDNWHRDNTITLSTNRPTGIRFIKLIAKTPLRAPSSGTISSSTSPS